MLYILVNSAIEYISFIMLLFELQRKIENGFFVLVCALLSLNNLGMTFTEIIMLLQYFLSYIFLLFVVFVKKKRRSCLANKTNNKNILNTHSRRSAALIYNLYIYIQVL